MRRPVHQDVARSQMGVVGHFASCQGFSRTGTLYPEPLRGAACPPGLWRNRAGQTRVSVLLGKVRELTTRLPD